MSQSPVSDFSSTSMLRYQQGWRALNRLLHEDRSFSGHERHCLFLNCGVRDDGDMRPFADVSSATGFDLPDDGRGIAVSDWDFDGDLDLWTTNRTAPRVRLLRNQLEMGNHFLAVKLQGDGRSVNRDAVGARIELYLAADDSTPLIRTVHAGESFLSQSSSWIHFGLAEEAIVDRIEVHWPGGGREVFPGPPTDRFYLLVQGAGQARRWTPPANRKQLLATATSTPPNADSESARIVVPAGMPFPEIRTLDAAGSETPWVSDARGPLLVNLWASWCGPCLQELTDWTRAADRLRDAGLEVLALNVDGLDGEQETTASAGEFLQRIEFPFESVAVADVTVKTLNAVQQATLDRWKPLPVPSSFLVDARGQIVVIYKGPVSVDQLLKDAALLTASPEERRTAAVPFPGRWVDSVAAPSSPRRVANQLLDQNRVAEARSYLYRIVETFQESDDADVRRELGDTWYFLGILHDHAQQTEKARAALSEARRLLPDDVRVRGDFGKLLMRIGRFAEAAEELTAATRINPHDLELGQHLGVTLIQLDQPEQAAEVLQAVIQQNSNNGAAWYYLANARLKSRRFAEAIEAYRRAVAAAPHLLEAANNLAWILSVHPDERLRAGEEAVALAQRLCQLTQFKEHRFLDTLAVAYAETGQFEQAAETAQQAIDVIRNAQQNDAHQAIRHEIQARLQLFQKGQPYRESTWLNPS